MRVGHGALIYCAAVESSTPHDPVAIIGGTGALGFGLAVRLGRAGVPVVIGSRDAGRAAEAAERARTAVPAGSFTGVENAAATSSARAVILSVPFRSQSETLKNVRDAWDGEALLIDATVPLAAAVSGKATRMLGVWQGSAAQAAQELVPAGVKVVSALHTVSAASLTALDHDLDQDVLVCGDSREDKRHAAKLIELIHGLRCVDCGRLEMARIAESMTALMISVNAKHKTHAGVKITGLPDDRWE